MKSRRVVVVQEIETDMPLRRLKSEMLWQGMIDCSSMFRTYTRTLAQVQVNVVNPKEKKPRKGA